MSGSALRIFTLISSILVSMYVWPFLVHTLGDRWYGVWSIAGTIVGYYSVLDLGLSVAAHRFLAISSARDDRDDTNRVFTTSFVLFSVAGLIALALSGAMWAAVPRFVAPADVATVRTLVLLLGVNFAAAFPFALFNGVLSATLRYDLSSYIQLGKVLLRTVVVVLALQRTPSVVVLALVTLGADMLGNVATAVAAWSLWPWLRLSGRFFDPARAPEFIRFGLFAFLMRVGDLVRFGVDSVIVGAFLGVETVTHYGIAIRLADYYVNVLTQAIGVLTPVFSRYHGLDESTVLVARMRQSSRLAVVFSASLAGSAVIFGGPFISHWMGAAYLDAYWPLAILMGATMIGVMQMPSITYLIAIGRHKYYAWLNGADAIVNLGLSLTLAPRFGMIGVALGTAIPAIVVKLILQPRYVCRQMGISLTSYWKEQGGVLARTLAAQAPIAAIVLAVRPTSYLSIFGLAMLLYGVYVLVLYLFVLGREDQEMLAGAVPALASLMTARRRVAALVVRGSH